MSVARHEQEEVKGDRGHPLVHDGNWGEESDGENTTEHHRGVEKEGKMLGRN